ncbi:MAG: glycoside hydrolase family 13 protein [bacterium]
MIKKYIFIVLFLISSAIISQTQISNIEPPYWWAGMKDCNLQILLHGINLSDYTPELNYEGVKITSVDRTENKNYLFVNLCISENVKSGMLIFSLTDNKNKFTFNYELKERNRDSKQLNISSADVIYLITPDRFANGDIKNDSLKGYFENKDRSSIKARHGGDIAGIKQKLPYIKEMGFTAIWHMPLLQNNMPIYSYHGYSITDFYNIDRRFGTNEEYVSFVKESHKYGLKIIKDMVFNQFGDQHYWAKDMPSKDWVHNWPQFTYSNFNGSVIPDPHASDYDKNRMNNGWFDKWMPDLNQKNPLVAKYLTQYTIWWVEYAGIDGIRMDTYQYNDKNYMNEWVARITNEYPNLFVVGEVWMDYPEIISYWKKGTVNFDGFSSKLESITDFPIHSTLNQVFTDYRPIYELYRVISRDFLYNNPNTNLIFADNHDVTRLFTFVNGDMNKYKQVIAFLLTTRGIPQIYYGTEILMTGENHEILRADYPGGWQEDKINAFVKEGRTDLQNEAFNYLTKLLNWRKSKNVIHTGQLVHFIPYNEMYVYFRENENECIMVAINKNKTDVKLEYDRHQEILEKYVAGKDVITNKKYFDLNNITIKANSVVIVELTKK